MWKGGGGNCRNPGMGQWRMISSTRYLVLDHDDTVPFFYLCNEEVAEVRIEGGGMEEELGLVSRGKTQGSKRDTRRTNTRSVAGA